MNWINLFKKNKSAVAELSQVIFEDSLFCAESLKKDLENRFGKDSKDFNAKYTPVLFEFLYFFLHHTNRMAFTQLGQEKRTKLQNEIVPLIAETTIETLLGHWPQNFKIGVKDEFYRNLNSRELEYGSCKELLLKPEDDIQISEKISGGKKSLSVVGQLVDNLSMAINGEMNKDILFTMKIWKVMIEILEKKRVDGLVFAVSKELK